MARITYNNGYYEGEVNSSGEEHGQGTYYYASGAKYVGQWSNDLKHGRGTMYFANGNTYEGEWANKTWGGYGKEIVYNGPTYEGFWRDNKNATNIVCTYPDGRVAHGKIVDGTFISN